MVNAEQEENNETSPQAVWRGIIPGSRMYRTASHRIENRDYILPPRRITPKFREEREQVGITAVVVGLVNVAVGGLRTATSEVGHPEMGRLIRLQNM